MAGGRYRVTVGERTYDVEVVERDGALRVSLDGGEPRAVDVRAGRDDLLHALIDGESLRGLVQLGPEQGTVVVRGVPFAVTVQDERAAQLAALASRSGAAREAAALLAPMPGLVVKVSAVVGAAVKKGEPLVILQAMKMENELAAPRDGTVKSVGAQAGQTVDQGQALVVLE